MPRWYSALGAAGLSSLLLAGAAQAAKPIPTKIDAGFEFRFNVQMGPQAFIPRAPWYTYFPVDPNLIANRPGTSPYPPWPTTFPPAPGTVPAQPQFKNAAPPVVPPAPQTRGWGWPVSDGGVQAAGYVPAQAPSYWYGR